MTVRFEDMRVLDVHPLSGYRLLLRYPDGYRLVDLSADIHAGGVFGKLKPIEAFCEVGADEYGVVTWPCNIQIGPDTLYEDSLRLSAERAKWLLRIPLEVSATGSQSSPNIVIEQTAGLRKCGSGEPGATEVEWKADFWVDKSTFLETRSRELSTK
ncbi:MAG: DUF2442 domain-containing protein [Sulfobacillus sp.]